MTRFFGRRPNTKKNVHAIDGRVRESAQDYLVRDSVNRVCILVGNPDPMGAPIDRGRNRGRVSITRVPDDRIPIATPIPIPRLTVHEIVSFRFRIFRNIST